MAEKVPGVTDQAVRDELGRVLASSEFAQSESLKRFLQHAVETTLDGRADELKETILGATVFERGNDYDPRLDPIVRVQATRLRSKLRDYYQAQGTPDAIVIELPKGTYVPEFRLPEEMAEPTRANAPKGVGVVLALAAAVIVVALVAALLWRSFWPASAGDVQSLVVLPFTDMSPGGDFGYYGDGLAEEITTTLAGADGLRVVPRTTAFAFRDRDLATVGEELRVDAVLQGSVRKAGDVLRIAAQLIQTRDGRQIWNESFEEDDDNAFQVQEGIARAVALAIEKELGVATISAPNPLAYEECLKARYELSRMTPASVARAIDLFESAIEADSDYAPAHAGLVQAYAVYVLWGFAPPDDTREQARQASELALALDGDHEEALAAAAAYQIIYEWDLARAQEILDRAADAGIRSDAIHTMQALVFLVRGDLDRAEAELEESIALAPHAPFVHYVYAKVVYFSGRDDDALRILSELHEWAPDYILAPGLISRIRLHQGEVELAEAALDEFDRVTSDSRLELALRAAFEAHVGREAEARALLATLQQSESYVPPAFVARVLTALGDEDGALDALERGARERSLPVLLLASDPDLDPLRSSERFDALLEMIGAR